MYHPTILRYVELIDHYQRKRISPEDVVERLHYSFDDPAAIDETNWAIFDQACRETKFPIEDVGNCFAEVCRSDSWEGYEDLEDALLFMCRQHLLSDKPLEDYL